MAGPPDRAKRGRRTCFTTRPPNWLRKISPSLYRHHPARSVRVIQFGNQRKIGSPGSREKRDRVMTVLFIGRTKKMAPGWPASIRCRYGPGHETWDYLPLRY